MKQQIKIMKHRPQLPDEEIQGYMNFEGLLNNRKSALQKASMVTVAKWSAALLVVTTFTFTMLYLSKRESSAISSNQVVSNEKPPVNEMLPLSDSSIIEKPKDSETSPVHRKDSKPNNHKSSAIQPTVKDELTSQAESEYIQAEPINGYDALYEYFNKNLVYPHEAVKDSIQGIQTVSFVINADGKPEQIQIGKPLGEAFDREARRLIENMPEWKPATLNGKPVPSKISVPLTFSVQSVEK